MSDKPLTLSVRLDGPLVENHRLPLSELERVAHQLRSAVRDVARVLARQPAAGLGGRAKRFIEEVSDLQVVGGAAEGSFVLELEVPRPTSERPELPGEFGEGLGEKAVQALVRGIGDLNEEHEQLPAGFDRSVLNHLAPFRPTLNKGVTAIHLRAGNGTGEPVKAEITSEKTKAAASLVKRPVRAEAVVEGVLQMVDYASLACRIDRPPKPSVLCTFDQKERESVDRARRQYVRVSGEGEFEPTQSEPRKITNAHIEIVYEALPLDPNAFWKTGKTVDQIAREQKTEIFAAAGIDPDDPWRNDEEAAALIDAIRGGST